MGTMKCEECGGSDAQPSEVTFSDGRGKGMTLCGECLERYREGEFVSEVVVLEDE